MGLNIPLIADVPDVGIVVANSQGPGAHSACLGITGGRAFGCGFGRLRRTQPLHRRGGAAGGCPDHQRTGQSPQRSRPGRINQSLCRHCRPSPQRHRRKRSVRIKLLVDDDDHHSVVVTMRPRGEKRQSPKTTAAKSHHRSPRAATSSPGAAGGLIYHLFPEKYKESHVRSATISTKMPKKKVSLSPNPVYKSSTKPKATASNPAPPTPSKSTTPVN